MLRSLETSDGCRSFVQEPLGSADEDAERGRVDEGGVGEVDDSDLAQHLVDHFELLLELGAVLEVDLAGERDNVGRIAQLLGVDVEVLRRTLPRIEKPPRV